MPESIQAPGRIPADARLHEPAPQPQPGRRGRPRVRGVRLPAPQDLLQAKGLRRVTLNFYESTTQHIRLAHMQGCLYRVPGRIVQVVIIEHLKGCRGIETFYSTVVEHEPLDVLQQYSWRWQIEVTFHDVKQHLAA